MSYCRNLEGKNIQKKKKKTDDGNLACEVLEKLESSLKTLVICVLSKESVEAKPLPSWDNGRWSAKAENPAVTVRDQHP